MLNLFLPIFLFSLSVKLNLSQSLRLVFCGEAVLCGAYTCYSLLFHTLFPPSLLNKKEQLGNWGNKRNPLCKLSDICIMSYARNMQMKHIIYECLRLSHSVPITYKEEVCLPLSLSSLLLSKLAWHAPHLHTRPILNKHIHTRACWLGTMTGREKLVCQTDGG